MPTKILPSGNDTDFLGDTDNAWKIKASSLDASGDVTIAGNLTVEGTTFTVNSTDTVIKDRLIELGNGRTGTPASTEDAGIIIERGGSPNAAIIWDEDSTSFVMGTTTSTAGATGEVSVTTGDLVANLGSGTTLTEVRVATELNDVNGAELITVGATSSAENHFKISNAATNNNPTLEAEGTDTDVGVNIKLKGAGSLDVQSSAATAAQIRLFEATNNGEHAVGLQASNLTESYTLKLPTALPASSGLSLVSTDDGTCSWNAVSTGGIGDNAVGLAQLADMSKNRILGRVGTAGDETANPENIVVQTTLSDSTSQIASAAAIKTYIDALVPATATALATARTIGGVSFDGSANIDLPGVNTTGTQNTTGSAATLTTARQIGGVSFNGSADIDLPGVNSDGNQNTSGNAATATALATARTIGGVSFDGSANIDLPGVNTTGTQNTTGSAATLTTARQIGGVSFDGSANIDLPGVNTTGTQNTTGSAATLTTARQIGGVSFNGSADIDLPGVNSAGNQDTSGNAATATALATARTIGGVSFDGSANINLPGVNATGTQDTSGNAATASALASAVNIGGVSFDGSSSINLPGVNASGSQDTSGNAATATVLATARTIGGVSFNGSANIDLPGVNSAGTQDTSGNAATATVLASARNIGGVSFNGSADIDLPGVNSAGTQDTSGNAATATVLATARTIGGVSFNGSADIDLPGVNSTGNQNTSGNAATATALASARNIGGVSFDGSANIDLPGVNTTGNQNTSGNAATATALATARNIGGVSFDGSANINLPGVNAAGNQDTSGNAATATALATARTIGGVSFDGSAAIVPNTITVADDEETNAARLILFADSNGTQQPKNDGDFTYNPSTGTVSATVLSGAVSTSSLTLGGTAVTATAAEINRLDITAAGTTQASSVVTTDSNNDISHTGVVTLSHDAGTDALTVTSGNITINSGDLTVAGAAQVTNTMTVNNKLTLGSSIATVGAPNVRFEDSLIELNYDSDDIGENRDLGFFGSISTSGNEVFQGFVFDGSDSIWKLGNTETEPNLNNTFSVANPSALQLDTIIIKKSAPSSSHGAPGDKAGMITYDGSYFYVCFQNYVGEGTACWKRIALSSDTW